VAPIDPKLAELGALRRVGSALCEFVVVAAPRLEVTIAVLRTIAPLGAEFTSLEIKQTADLHTYDLRVAHLPFEAATALAAQIERLDGVVSATFERWRVSF
jgi:hypothetical protein